jgi:hypothetical protein
VQALIVFIEAVPALVKLVTLFVDKWQDYQYSKLVNTYNEKDLKRLSLIQAVRKADNDDQRKALVRMLYDLNTK